MTTRTEEKIAEGIRQLDADVRDGQREIVLRLERIERETEGQRWRSQNLPTLIFFALYVSVLIVVLAIVIATKVVVSHL